MAEIALQDIVDYIDFVKNAKKLANMYKEAFEAYITDKSIPLDLRWSLWLDAPSELKNNQSDIHHWKSVDEDLQFGGWFSRYQTLSTVDMLEMVEGEDDREAFKEEILENNLESYCFDW